MMIIWNSLWASAATAWHGFGGETKGAIIQAAGTLIAAALGFGAVVWQIGSQGRLSRLAIEHAEKRKLKSELFGECVAIAREFSDHTISFYVAMVTAQTEFKYIAAVLGAAAQPAQLPSIRYSVILGLNQAFSGAALKLIFLVEQQQFIDPRILIFKDALTATMHDLRELVQSRFVNELMPLLPVDAPDGTLMFAPELSAETADAAAALTGSASALLSQADAITADFQTAMQNLLMADLFGTRVPSRVPLDPSYKVWTLEDAEQLGAWLATETAWGQEAARVEAQTRAQLRPNSE